MKIEPEDLKGFQRLWEEQFQVKLNDEESLEKATHLLELMKAIYKPMPKPKTFERKQQLSILDFNQSKI